MCLDKKKQNVKPNEKIPEKPQQCKTDLDCRIFTNSYTDVYCLEKQCISLPNPRPFHIDDILKDL